MKLCRVQQSDMVVVAAGLPSVCSLPHSLHFSQPTQSITRVMFWKVACSWRFSSAACSPFQSRPSSNGIGQDSEIAGLDNCTASGKQSESLT